MSDDYASSRVGQTTTQQDYTQTSSSSSSPKSQQNSPVRQTTASSVLPGQQQHTSTHQIQTPAHTTSQPDVSCTSQPQYALSTQPTGGESSTGATSYSSLPQGTTIGNWVQYFTETGMPYYYNIVTNDTQWETPPGFVPHTTSPPQNLQNMVDPQCLQKIQGLLLNQQSQVHVPAKVTSGPQGANVFVFHVPKSWTENELFQHFSPFGTILSARVQRDAHGRTRGFAFVSYDSHASAQAAINTMHGFPVEGKWLKVQLKKGEEHYNPQISGVSSIAAAQNAIYNQSTSTTTQDQYRYHTAGYGPVGGMQSGINPRYAPY